MEDKKIIALYWQRDEAAITETNSKYGKYCMTIADNILSDHQESEECINDTWFKAWNSMPPNKPVKLKLFLAKITRNLSFDRFRKRNALKRGGGEMVYILDELKSTLPSSHDVENEMITNEMIKSMNACLQSMPDKHRIIFLKRYFYAESIKDIADCFGISQNNVLMILSRTRAKLHSHLCKEEYIL